jgi:hypothetical protein
MSEESALGHALTLKDYCGSMPEVYECKDCGKWHVGYSKYTSHLSKSARRKRTFMNRKRRRKRANGSG